MVSLLGEQILDLRYYFWTEAKIAGVPVVVTRTGWTSEVGYEVYTTDTSRGNEVYEAIMEAGAAFGIKPTGPSRHPPDRGRHLQLGRRHDVREQRVPDGARASRRSRLADRRREPVHRRATGGSASEGVAERINGVTFDGEPFPALNAVKWPASVDGASVGKVTSAIHSPRLNLNIGYCWLPSELSVEGRIVRVETEWGTRSATVTPMPFVDPSKQIPVS